MDRRFKGQVPQPTRNNLGFSIITEEFICEACDYEGHCSVPKFINTLYLHFKSFQRIENLENFLNLKVLYLESNCISKIERLENLKNLTCLYLQDNNITKIENLDENTELSVLKLSRNRIEKIENLGKLTKLHNLNLEKNCISSFCNIKKLSESPSIAVLDLQSNMIADGEHELEDFFGSLSNLKVLYFKGNEVCGLIKNYRRAFCAKINSLTYLDDKSVDEIEREGAKAYFRGGYEEERRVKLIYRMKKEGVENYNPSEERIRDDGLTVEERRIASLNKLLNEFLQRKTDLETNKRRLMERFRTESDKKMEISHLLMDNDTNLEENEDYMFKGDKDSTHLSKLESFFSTASMFKFESWMDSIIELNLIKSNFDFKLACDFLRIEFIGKGVKNIELLNDFELRLKWTQIESIRYRNNENAYFDCNFELKVLTINDEKIKQSNEKLLAKKNAQEYLKAIRNQYKDEVGSKHPPEKHEKMTENFPFKKITKEQPISDDEETVFTIDTKGPKSTQCKNVYENYNNHDY